MCYKAVVFLTRLRSVTFYRSGSFTVITANFAPKHPREAAPSNGKSMWPVHQSQPYARLSRLLIGCLARHSFWLVSFFAAGFLIIINNITQHNTKIRKIKRAWMDAWSGQSVGKDEYWILSWPGREDPLYIKMYKADQEYSRMYVGGYVKVNAWILKVCLPKFNK